MIDAAGKYLYMIPLIFSVCLLGAVVIQKTEQRNFSVLRPVNLINRVFKERSKIRLYYMRHFIKDMNIGFEKLIIIKLSFLIGFLLMLTFIRFTDITYEMQRIKSSKDYKVSDITRGSYLDRDRVYELETAYLESGIEAVSGLEMSSLSRDEFSHILKSGVFRNTALSRLETDEVIRRLYIRIKEYYRIKKFNIIIYLFVGVLMSFLPEAYLLIKDAVEKNDRKRELIFLKRLMIMCGSIKPVVYQDVLNLLIDKSIYYRETLTEINRSISKNNNNADKLYNTYITKTSDIDEKLFFEKLQMADEYDFSLAVENIKNEFRITQRENSRKVKKRVELIHIAGVLGVMILIFIWVLYLILPWMDRFDMEGII